MKTNYILLPLLALTLAACDQPAPKNDKPATPNQTTAPQDDKKVEKPGDAPAEPAPPPVFKTAEEALPYIQSQLPYDTKESSFRTVALDKGVFTFTAVIKGVEDAAAFQASHNMEALTGAYQQNIKPYICEQEPLKSLWQKKKIRSVHFDYQDEHAQPIMQIDIAAADCAVPAEAAPAAK